MGNTLHKLVTLGGHRSSKNRDKYISKKTKRKKPNIISSPSKKTSVNLKKENAAKRDMKSHNCVGKKSQYQHTSPKPIQNPHKKNTTEDMQANATNTRHKANLHRRRTRRRHDQVRQTTHKAKIHGHSEAPASPASNKRCLSSNSSMTNFIHGIRSGKSETVLPPTNVGNALCHLIAEWKVQDEKLAKQYEDAQQHIRDSVRKEQRAKCDAQTWREKLEKLATLHRERLFKQASILRSRLDSAEKKLGYQENKTRQILHTNHKLKGMINTVKEEARSLRVISEKKRESSRKMMHDKLALVEGELDKLRTRVVKVDTNANSIISPNKICLPMHYSQPQNPQIVRGFSSTIHDTAIFPTVITSPNYCAQSYPQQKMFNQTPMAQSRYMQYRNTTSYLNNTDNNGTIPYSKNAVFGASHNFQARHGHGVATNSYNLHQSRHQNLSNLHGSKQNKHCLESATKLLQRRQNKKRFGEREVHRRDGKVLNNNGISAIKNKIHNFTDNTSSTTSREKVSTKLFYRTRHVVADDERKKTPRKFGRYSGDDNEKVLNTTIYTRRSATPTCGTNVMHH